MLYAAHSSAAAVEGIWEPNVKTLRYLLSIKFLNWVAEYSAALYLVTRRDWQY